MAQATKLDRLYTDVGELLAERRTGPERDELTSYADDPVGFIRDVLDGEPWRAQREVAEAVRDRPMVAVQSCNGTGKDWLAGRLALWWCYARRGLVVLTGPTRQQVEEILMRREVHTAFRRSGLPGSLHVRALRPGGEGRAGIIAKTASEVSGLTGLHDARVLVCISEAQAEGLEDAFGAAFANAVGDEDRIFVYGNPLNPTGEFYKACHNPDWHTVKLAAADVPNVREGETVVPGLMTRAGVERIASQYGEDSPFYTARVLGEFPEETQQGLVRRSWIEAAVEREPVVPTLQPRVVAVDVARSDGGDLSAAAVRQGDAVREIVTWRSEDTMATVDRIERLLDRLTHPDAPRVQTVVVDEAAVGGGVYDRLRERLKGRPYPYRHARTSAGMTTRRTKSDEIRVQGFKSSRKAGEPERFLNLRAHVYWMVRERLERGELALPDDPELAEELWSTRWTLNGKEKIQLEAKPDLKARLSRSPDKADAVAMTMATEITEAGTIPLSWA